MCVSVCLFGLAAQILDTESAVGEGREETVASWGRNEDKPCRANSIIKCIDPAEVGTRSSEGRATR